MALTTMELQLLQQLQQKQLADTRANQAMPVAPMIPIPPPQQQFDINSLNTIIDQKVAERVGILASQMSPQPTQQAQPPTQQVAPQPPPAQEQNPMLQFKSPDKAFMDRLRPLFMAALTLEQKGRLAEIAFSVHSQSQSTEQAYRVGFDALCGFLETPTGREWIQVGTNAFFQALETHAQVPASIGVQTK
jgi:hypothetical protein